MNISGKEIITLSAILAEQLTKGLSPGELAMVKVFVNQLNCDINTIYALKTLKNGLKNQK